MNPIPVAIIKYIEKQTCATIACLNNDGAPHCFNCFYAFDASSGILCYKSSEETRHTQLLYKNKAIAGTILPDRLKTMMVQGIQFSGCMVEPDDIDNKVSRKYFLRFPFAVTMPGTIWYIRLQNIKMTDSSKVFAKKIRWERDPVNEL